MRKRIEPKPRAEKIQLFEGLDEADESIKGFSVFLNDYLLFIIYYLFIIFIFIFIFANI